MIRTRSLFYGPSCRCGSGCTTRVGDSALLRFCNDCGETYAYRLHDGHLIPMAPLTALALDEQRRHMDVSLPNGQGRPMNDAELDSTPLTGHRLTLVDG